MVGAAQLAREARDALLGLVYPQMCAGCEEPLPAEERAAGLCVKCRGRLERIERPFCELCGEPYPADDVLRFRCANCSDREFHFAYAVAGYRARSLVRDLVHRFKYGREIHLCRVLAPLMERALEDERLRGEIEAAGEWRLVPVPLHGRRQRERGFNQAAELGRFLARGREWRVADVLKRTRYTTMQARLDREQRLENLRGAFRLRRRPGLSRSLGGRKILLLDDILTTGATANECARVLVEEGKVDKVVVLTVARG